MAEPGAEVIKTQLNFRSYKVTICRAMNANFDSGMIPVGIDSCTSATVSGEEQLFIGRIEPVTGMWLNGVSGAIPIIGKGTMQLTFDDDAGQRRQHLIHDAYFAPRLRLTLLSPRQWTNQGPRNRKLEPVRSVSLCGDAVTMHFEGYGTKTIALSDGARDIPILHTKPGRNAFCTFLMSQHLTAHEARTRPTALTLDQLELPPDAVLQDRELRRAEREKQATAAVPEDPFDLRGSTAPTLRDTFVDTFQEPEIKEMNFDDILTGEWDDTAIEANLPELTERDKKTLMLRWHYRLGHMPFKDLKATAKAGLLDKRLATIGEFPFCPGCQFGKAHKRQWRHRSKKKDGSRKRIRQATRPGEVVSLDTMDSRNVPGLMPQLRGTPTRQRYHYATVFVDHYSDLTYVHLHQYNDGASVLEAKLAFERYASSFGVQVSHYHCDNGIFADNSFKAACKAARQTCSYCGVNAHHQNGKAEKRIRDVRDSARTMLILARHNWKEAITVNLWGFAMIYASQIRNSTLREGELRTSLQKFAKVTEPPNVHVFHTFGCPVYNLDPKLQSGGSLESKWSERARIGIFLGLSREHATSVSVVLNPDTGLTSPQFHVKHDERFETVGIPAMKDIGKWQEVTHIHEKREMKKQSSNKRQKKGTESIDNAQPVTDLPAPEGTSTTEKRPIEENQGTSIAASVKRRRTKAQQTPQREAQRQTQAEPSQREKSPTQAELSQREKGEGQSFQRETAAPDVTANQTLDVSAPSGFTMETPRETVTQNATATSEVTTQTRTDATSGIGQDVQGSVTQQVMALLAHRSISQKRKRNRDETEGTETANSLEESRRTLELTLRTYHTTMARKVHAEELAT